MGDATLVGRARASVRSLRGDGKGWTLTVVASGWLLALGTRYLLPAILPQIKTTFGVTNAAAGVAITLVWGAYALMQFPAGILVDRIGERTLLSASLGLAAGSLVALSIAPAFVVFAASCGLFGLATGLYGPPRGTVLSRTFAESEGAAFGLTLAVGSLGSAALPYLASVLVDSLDWRVVIALAIGPFLGVALSAWRVIPSLPANGGEADVGGKPPGGDGTDAHETSSDGANGDGVSGDGTSGDEGDERPTVRDLLGGLRAAVSRRSVAVSVAAITLLLFVLQGLTAFLPTYLIAVKGLSQEVAAGLFALFFLSGALFQWLGGSGADRYGDRVVLLTLAAFGVVPLLALPFVSGTLPLAVLVVLMGSRLGIAPVSNAYVIGVLPTEVRGTAWGALRTGFFLVASTGSVFVGVLADRGLFDESMVVLALLTAVAAALYVHLPARTRG